jgi:hypothetical protein
MVLRGDLLAAVVRVADQRYPPLVPRERMERG